MTQDEVVESTVELICKRDWVTFVEIEQHLERSGIETDGNFVVEACPNGMMWVNMSQEFVDIVMKLRDDERVTVESGEWLAYLIDGRVPGLPVAKRPPRDPQKGYHRPRWIVTLFRPRSA